MEKLTSKIKVLKDGSYLVMGSVPLRREEIFVGSEGIPLGWKVTKEYPLKKEYRLCRCGSSKINPYCEDEHTCENMDNKETASNVTFEDQAEVINGPELTLKDAVSFCANARFCDRAGGVWELTKKSDDEALKKIAIEEACNCPSGRLVEFDKNGKEIEPDFSPSISETFDEDGRLGPLWVKGRIPIESADGKTYEIRNRVTLCRCGLSKNKPFCDGSHYLIPKDEIDPIYNLFTEHGLIRTMVKILKKMNETEPLNENDLKDAIIFLKDLADKCHHGKEEDFLFVEMGKNNIPKEKKLIEELLREHQEARDYTEKMSQVSNFSEFSKKYIALLNGHIDRENKILFPGARVSLSSDQIEKLKHGFADLEEKIGKENLKNLYSINNKLKEKYL